MRLNLFLLGGVILLVATTAVSQQPPRQPRAIPGTDLKTQTFYTFSLLPFPTGYVTWALKTSSTFNYITIDGSPPDYPRNTVGGNVWSQDYLWEFIPVHYYGWETGWYGLRNRGRQTAYLTWGHEYTSEGYYAVLDQVGERRKENFYVKPVKAQFEGRSYYQLKLQDYPDAAVTWTAEKYGESSHYLQVDNNGDWVELYKEGGAWFRDTLFSVQDSHVIEKEEEVELGYH